MALLHCATAPYVTWAGTYYASVLLFSIVPYLRVPIVLCPSHLLFPVYIDKHLYDKNLNNMIYGNNYKKSQVIGSVM